MTSNCSRRLNFPLCCFPPIAPLVSKSSLVLFFTSFFALSLCASSFHITSVKVAPTKLGQQYRHRSSSSLFSNNRTSSNVMDENGIQIKFVTNKRCPYAQKAWIALEASQCSYQLQEVSLYGAGGKPDWFWKLNPKGTVPVVAVTGKDDGKDVEVFADSELILDAIGDGTLGNGEKSSILNGGNDDERARIAQWRGLVSKDLASVGKSAVLGGSVPKLRSLLKQLNELLVGPYLIGDDLTLADCAAFPFLWRIDQEFGVGGSGERKLRLWLDKCVENEAIQRTIPLQGWWWWW